MKYWPVALSIILIIAGAFASRQYQVRTMKTVPAEVLSEKVTTTPTSDPTQALSPTNAPKTTLTPTPENNMPGNFTDIGQFRYPEAKVINLTAQSISLESSDNTDNITDWYKDKIESLGVNVKTFVKATTNDKVLNKLAGANNNFEIKVEVSQDSAEAKVRITVTLK